MIRDAGSTLLVPFAAWIRGGAGLPRVVPVFAYVEALSSCYAAFVVMLVPGAESLVAFFFGDSHSRDPLPFTVPFYSAEGHP